MRILDVAHNWALGTHRQYQGKIGVIKGFCGSFGIPFLTSLKAPAHPPISASIPLMWIHENESLIPSRRVRGDQEPLAKQYSSIRSYRSAASYYESVRTVIDSPDDSYLTERRHLLMGRSRFTDSAVFSYFSGGLKSRIGDESHPSVALLGRHIEYLDRDLDARYRASRVASDRGELALAGFANLTFWLGWLRSNETFSLTWGDLSYIDSASGPARGLPRGVGALLYKLLPETKSTRTHRVDLVCCLRSHSGLNLDRWYHRCRGHFTCRPTEFIFRSNGRKWDSAFFRKTYLYPALRALRAEGDPFLQAFDEAGRNSLEAKFWSMHSYRRGARSHVSKHKDRSFRASEVQIYEHARWRLKRSGERVDVMYREWTLTERIAITLYSM